MAGKGGKVGRKLKLEARAADGKADLGALGRGEVGHVDVKREGEAAEHAIV